MLIKIYPNLTGTQKTPSTDNLFRNLFSASVVLVYLFVGYMITWGPPI